MSVARRLLKFTAGGATGTVIGLAVGSLLAPQRGADLQHATQDLIARAKSDGQAAQDRTERELKERFRKQVNDPTAFSSQDSSAKV